MPFPVDEKLIEAAETQLGQKLPEKMRLRLMQSNGDELAIGEDDWIIHPVWDPTDRRTMARTANHIVRETEQARGWQGFPEGAIALASDGAGNRLIVRKGSARIEIWNHETGSCSSCEIEWDRT